MTLDTVENLTLVLYLACDVLSECFIVFFSHRRVEAICIKMKAIVNILILYINLFLTSSLPFQIKVISFFSQPLS